MKLIYPKVPNVIIKPLKYTEAPTEYYLNDNTDTFYKNSSDDTITQDINKDILISQLVRLTSLIGKAVDLSALPQEQQDSITSIINIFEAYPMMGDQMLATDGRGLLDNVMASQETYANNNSEVTGETVIADPYQGFENIAKTSSLSSQERSQLIDAIFAQDTSSINDLDAGDQLIITDFIDTAVIGVLLGSYGPTSAGQDLHESLGISPGADLALIFTEHIKGGTIYNSDESLFIKVYA